MNYPYVQKNNKNAILNDPWLTEYLICKEGMTFKFAMWTASFEF